MGYRSDVALTMLELDYQNMLKKAFRESKDIALPFITRYTHLYKSNDIITVYWSCVKWYEEYEDVKFVIDFVHSGDIPYKFVRVGESPEDIEEDFNGNHYEMCDIAYATNSISIDAGDVQNIDKYLESIEFEEDDDAGSNISDDELYKIITA